MALRNYVNTSKEGQLSLPIGTGDTTITLTAPGLVNIPSTPFYVRLDPDTASEELILVGSGSSATSLQNCTRGFDGTTAFSHLAGTKARHCVAAEFYNKADAHVEASTNVHGLSGGAAVVGTTQTQTVTNKTINASVIDVAHSTSPAGSQAVKVSADDPAGRDGFVWDNTGGSSGRSLVVRSGGVDRFVVSGVGLVTSNSATGTDKALSVQQSATERFFLQNDGHADFGLQTAGATDDRVVIRNRPTQAALRIRDEAAASVFSVGSAGNVDASGYVATASNLSAAGTLSVTGTSSLTGDVTLPLPAAGTTSRLIVNSRTGGTNFEGRNQAGSATAFLRATGQLELFDKAYIHNGSSPIIAMVTNLANIPSPSNPMIAFDQSDGTVRRYNGTSWDAIQRFGTQLANPIGLISGQQRGSNSAGIAAETEFISTGTVSLLANSVYRVDLMVRFFISTTNDVFIIRLRDNDTSGTLRVEFNTEAFKTATTPYNVNISLLYKTTSAEASRSFIGSAVRLSGSGTLTAETATAMSVSYLGPSSLITTI